MKKFTKKMFAALGIFALSASGVFALDFGGLLDNSTVFKTNAEQNFKLDQKNSASFWVRQSLNKTGSNYFIAEAIYNFEKDFSGEETVTTNALDSDLFKLVLNKNTSVGLFSLSAGRFFYCDLSGLAYSQTADGLLLSFNGNRIEASLYGAYTGLLNAQNVKILTSKVQAKDHPASETDIFGQTHTVEDNYFFEPDKDALYDLAEKYVIGSAMVSFPNLFAGQTLNAQVLGTFRVEHEGYTRVYAGLGLNGPITGTIFYNISSTLGIDNYNGESTHFSNLTVVNLIYYLPFASTRLQLNGSFASGEYGDFGSFKGFTEINATCSLMDVQYEGIAKCGLSFSMKPVRTLTLFGAADLVFDASGDYYRGEAAGLGSDKEMSSVGFQYSAGLAWQIVSDVMVGADVSQYFDGDGSDYLDKTAFTIKAALSF